MKAWVLAGMTLGVSGAWALTDVKWTNGQGTGHWSDAGNWSGTVVPNAATYRVVFDNAADVALDTGAATTFGALQSAGSGKTVTIRATEGSVLVPDSGTPGLTSNGFNVPAGGTLAIHAPVTASRRVDKWGVGTLVTDAVWENTATGYPFIFGAGTNVFCGAAELLAPNGSLSFANGSAGVYSPTFLRDRAKIAAKTVDMAVGGDTAVGEVIQEGAETEVRVAGNLTLNSVGLTRTQRWTQRAGVFESGGVVVGGKYGNGRGQLRVEGGSFATTNLTVQYGTFQMAGGEAVVRNALRVTGSTGTVEVAGGTLTVDGTLSLTNAAMTVSGGEVTARDFALRNGARFDLAGGRLTTRPGCTGDYLFFRSKDFRIRGGELAVNDTYELNVDQTVDGGRLVVGGAGKTVRIGAGVELSCAAGAYRPFGVTVKAGNSFFLKSGDGRVTAPLDLEVESGASVSMANNQEGRWNRGLLVAHRLVVNGVEQPKGRYAGGSDWFKANASSTVAVPYVWTGAAGDGRWANPGNWDGNAVPPSNTTSACVDLSRASGGTVTLDADVSVSCLIMNGVTGTRRLTLAGGRKLTFGVPQNAACGLYVGPGREIVFDVDVDVDSSSPQLSFLGGGRVTVKRGFVNSPDSHSPRVSLDATLVFAGQTALANGLSLWTHENEGRGVVRFEDGRFSTFHVCAGRNGFYGVHEFIQDGGDVALSGGLYMTYGNFSLRSPERYSLHAGALAVGTGVFLGSYLSSGWLDRRPGGDFFMDGGTLTAPKLAMEANANRYYLYGGTVNLGAGGFVREHNTANLKEYRPNEDHVYLGGATIRSTAASASTLNLLLDGTDATTFDTTGGAMTLNGNLGGTGQLRKLGGTALTLNGTNTLTGSIAVEAGTFTFGTKSKIGGTLSISAAEGAALYLLGETAPNLMVSAARAQDVYLPAGTTATVAKFVVGGVAQAPGSYSVGSGTIVVAPAATDTFVWTGANGGEWTAAGNWTDFGVPRTDADEVDFAHSPLPAEAAINLDAEVSLKSIAYSHPAEGAVLTVGAGGTLTFPDNGQISVAAGCTLVFDCDVHAAGYLYKYGAGRVVFRGKLRSAVDPFTLTKDVSFYRTRAGVSEIRGEVAGLRIWTDVQGVAKAPPRCVFADGAVATNRVSVNMCWISMDTAGTAETVQNGGRVDMTPPTPNFSPVWAFGYNHGGVLRYVLNDGYFSLPRNNTENRVEWNAGATDSAHTFTFEQNGGTSVFHRFAMGDRAGQNDLVQLNAGTLRVTDAFFARAGRGTARVELNGGTLAFDNPGRMVAFPSAFRLQLGGDVDLDSCADTVNAIVEAPLAGAGTVTQKGPGLVDFRATTYIDGGFEVEAGRLALSAATAATNFVVRGGSLEFVNVTAAGVPAASTVRIDRGATLRLSGTGELVVKRLTLGGQSKAAGVYGAGAHGAAFFTGDGTLRVLEGSEAGSLVIIR